MGKQSFAIFLSLIISLVGTLSFASDSKTLYFVTLKSKENFDRSAVELFKENTKMCSLCEIIPAYVGDDKGLADIQKVTSSLGKVPEKTRVIVFDFNFKPAAGMEKWGEPLQKLQEKGVLVFAHAGSPEPGERPRLLSQTYFGTMKDVFLFAELSIGERMWPDSHFGPEIFTSKKMPESYAGQGLVALDFASRWLAKSEKRTTEEWLVHLKEKKKNSRRLWVDASELF